MTEENTKVEAEAKPDAQIEQDGPKIIFFCKDCDQVVDTERCGKKYVYRCRLCGTKNVAFGTLKSINNFFHVKEKEEKAMKDAAREAAKSASGQSEQK